MLTIEVTFEITVSLKILIRMKPETVFIKRDWNVEKNRQLRVPCEGHSCDMVSNPIHRFVLRSVEVDEFVNWSLLHIRQVFLDTSWWDESLNDTSLLSENNKKHEMRIKSRNLNIYDTKQICFRKRQNHGSKFY